MKSNLLLSIYGLPTPPRKRGDNKKVKLDMRSACGYVAPRKRSLRKRLGGTE